MHAHEKALVTITAPTTGKLYSITAVSAPFFRHGPQEGRQPDKILPKDTLVKLIRPSFGYLKIQLVDSGQQGYVASEDINVAPPTLIAAVTCTARKFGARLAGLRPASRRAV